MNQFNRMIFTLLALSVLVWNSVTDASDVVYRKSDSKRVSGNVTKMTKTEIVVKPTIGNKPEVVIPANDIEEIRWDGEPPEMMLLRSAEKKESYQKALEGYEKILEQAGAGQKNLKADLVFLIARAREQLADLDEKQIDETIEMLEKFRKTNPDHVRYYESLKILNRLYRKKDEPDKVREISELIATAPWQEFKDLGKLDKANSLLASGDALQAEKLFDEIIEEYKGEPQSEQLMKARLGKAGCLNRQKNFEESEKLVNQILDQIKPEQTRLFAETYLRQGELYRLSGRPKDSILAYLHIDLVFNREKRAHEESLYWLASLWKEVGQETRSLKCSEKLKKEYPDSQWISKLN